MNIVNTKHASNAHNMHTLFAADEADGAGELAFGGVGLDVVVLAWVAGTAEPSGAFTDTFGTSDLAGVVNTGPPLRAPGGT